MMISQSELDFQRSTGIDPSKRIHLEISLGCNISCSMCTFHDSLEKIQLTPLEQIKTLDKSISYFGSMNIGDSSEPFINPNWDKIVHHITSLGIKISLQTNSKLINTIEFANRILKSRLHILRFSIDGITNQTVQNIRSGINFTTIENAIKLVNQAKTKNNTTLPHLAANCVARRSNLDEIPDLVDFLLKNGFKKIRIGFLELRKPNKTLLPELLIYYPDLTKKMINEVKNRIKRHGDNIFLDMALFDKKQSINKRNHCSVYQELMYVKYNGDASLCFGRVPIGNIYGESVKTCLTSENYNNAMKTLSQKNNPICSQCNYCQIMSFNNIQDHFGKAALQYYSPDVVTDSLNWVLNGGSPDNFWNQYF